MTTLLLLALFVLLTACSAYFSCSETAFFSVDPLQLRRIGEDNPSVGEQLRIMLANPTRLLSTILIGNTLVNIALSNVGYTLVRYLVPPGWERWDELVAVPAITILLIFFGEVGPKNIGLLHTAAIIRVASPPLRALSRVLAPLRMLLELVSRRLARHFRPAGKTLSEEEFETVLDISGEEGVINADELAMIKSIVDLEDLSAADVMTPRVDFSGIDLDDPHEDYLAIARRSRKHYLILYRSHLDNIAGFLDVRKYLLDPAHSIPAATIPPGGGGSGSQTEDVLTGLSFGFDSRTHQLTATLTKKRLTVISKADISGAAPKATLPLYENDVVVGSDYNDSVQHVFNNFTRKGVITGSDSQPTPAQVFTSTAHSAE